MRASLIVFAALLAGAAVVETQPPQAGAVSPLTFGETFTIESKTLGETRRINVYKPPSWDEPADAARPVLYMPDGGMAEDFLHIAGLVQVSVGNGSMRPVLLVGIENTQRRRDMTGPTTNPEDMEIAPQVGGSAAFRAFIRSELMPAIKSRYKTTEETAIMGESLAGLFVVETLLLEPGLFSSYIAFDPSLWWNNKSLLSSAAAQLKGPRARRTRVYLASSGEKQLATLTAELAAMLKSQASPMVESHYTPMPDETHGTIYHPAALRALRHIFGPGGALALHVSDHSRADFGGRNLTRVGLARDAMTDGGDDTVRGVADRHGYPEEDTRP